MKTKIFLSAIFVGVCLFFLKMYEAFHGSLEGQLAANQVDDNTVTYAVTSMTLDTNIPVIALTTLLGLLCFIWIPWLYKKVLVNIK